MLRGRLERDRDPGILGYGLPADEAEPSAGPERRPEISERGRRVAEEHDPEARVEDVEGLRGEAMRLGVGVLEAHVRDPRLPGRVGGPGQHRCRDVDPEDEPRGPDPSGERDRRVAAAAAYVDHA